MLAAVYRAVTNGNGDDQVKSFTERIKTINLGSAPGPGNLSSPNPVLSSRIGRGEHRNSGTPKLRRVFGLRVSRLRLGAI